MTGLSKYQDKQSFWHHKPCVNGKPSSNNGYIYTAYAKYLAPDTLQHGSIRTRYHTSVKTQNPLRVTRLPGKETPPVSKDEILGMVSLGLLSDATLKESHYNFCSLDRDFDRKLTFKSFFKAAYSLFKIRKEHRNYFWQEEMVECYPLAFWLDPADQYYVRKMAGKKASISQTIFFYVNFFTTLKGDNKSSHMMNWLKCEDLNKKFLLRFIDKKKIVANYFGKDHDLYTRNWK